MNAIPKQKDKLINVPIYLLIETVLNSLIEGKYFDEQQKQCEITLDMLRLEYRETIPAFIKLCTIELSDIDKPGKYQIIDLVNMVYNNTSYTDARHAYLFNLQHWLQKSKDADCPEAIKHMSAADVLVQTAGLINYKPLSENESQLVKKLHAIYDFDGDNNSLLIMTLRTVAPSVMRLIDKFSKLDLKKHCGSKIITNWQSDDTKKDYFEAADTRTLSNCQVQQYSPKIELSSQALKGM